MRAIVLETIARHLGCSPVGLREDLHLERDLELTPLELVLIACELEEACGRQIPVEGLEDVETVGELTAFFTAASSMRPTGTR
jgi:acyl carrier protein